MKLRIAAFIFALLAAGCAAPTLPPGLGDNQAIVAPKLIFTIPEPASAGRKIDLAQSIVAKFRGQSYVLDMQIAIDKDKLDLVALDGFGRRALTVSWSKNAPAFERAPWLPPVFRPADIVASFVIAYWPDEVVAAALKTPGVSVVTKNGVRRISRSGRDLIVVVYGPGEGWNRSAKLKNLAFGYEIEVQSSEIGN
jgi:hypothetical protein